MAAILSAYLTLANSSTPSATSASPVPQSNCHPSPQAKESWKGIDVDPNHPSRWICSYLKENCRVPEWWREFQSLILSPDECFRDILVQRMACQQVAAFRLPATQLEQDGSWTTPPCLGLLEQRDFLPPKDFKGAQDYWVVWAEETVALAKALQRCAVCSRMPLGVLCGAVQELHNCFTSVVQSGDIFDLEMLDVAEKDPMAPASEGRALLPMPRAEPLVGVTASNKLSA